MITKSYIEKNLKEIESLYNHSSSPKQSLYYSKLALLELCGWIENSLDDIVIRLSKRLLRNITHQTYLTRDVIKIIHCFTYETNFRRMLEAIIGLNGVELMEMKVDRRLFDPMVGTLGSLKGKRDDYAHNYIKGITMTLDAPSRIKMYFYTIYNGLINVDNVLKTIKSR